MKTIHKWYMLALCLICGMTLTACSEDEPISGYFVRYTMYADPNGEVFMSYIDVDGEHIIQGKHPDGKVEVTVGPVEPGFEAAVAATVDGHAPEWLSIEVAKGSGPFTKLIYQSHGISLTYTVQENT